MRIYSIFCAFMMSCLLIGVAAADNVKTVRVKFGAGETGATVHGQVRGYDTMQYLVGARAGQTMDVVLSTASTSAYMNVFKPGDMPGESTALFAGDTAGNHFHASLPVDGNYLIQIYLYRNAARKNESASFNVKISIANDQGAGSESSNDALVAGTDFNATGDFSCSRVANQPMGQCKFGVKRKGDGSGEITIFWPDGGTRVIFFKNNVPASYDQSEADGGATMRVTQDSDVYKVQIGDQRFEFPDILMTGD